jgi:hypothetical protein
MGARPSTEVPAQRVRFHAEVWVNDYANEIDPLGPTEWDVADLNSLLAGYVDVEDAFRYERWFDFDPACPEWIKAHSGPFWIERVPVAPGNHAAPHTL